MRRIARGEQVSVASWNGFGMLGLIAVVAAPDSRLQILHVGVGFSLVPIVIVPFYLIIHSIVAAQLVTQRKAQSWRRRDRVEMIDAWANPVTSAALNPRGEKNAS